MNFLVDTNVDLIYFNNKDCSGFIMTGISLLLVGITLPVIGLTMITMTSDTEDHKSNNMSQNSLENPSININPATIEKNNKIDNKVKQVKIDKTKTVKPKYSKELEYKNNTNDVKPEYTISDKFKIHPKIIVKKSSAPKQTRYGGMADFWIKARNRDITEMKEDLEKCGNLLSNKVYLEFSEKFLPTLTQMVFKLEMLLKQQTPIGLQAFGLLKTFLQQSKNFFDSMTNRILFLIKNEENISSPKPEQFEDYAENYASRCLLYFDDCRVIAECVFECMDEENVLSNKKVEEVVPILKEICNFGEKVTKIL